MKRTLALILFASLCGLSQAQWLHLPIMRQAAYTFPNYWISNSFGGTWPTHSYSRFWALDFKYKDHWLYGQWWTSYDKPVLASAWGKVVWTGYDGWYGRTVMIDHQNGYTTLYAHLNSIWVSTGQWVNQHTGIGAIGGSGVAGSQNPHLHWELRRSGTSQSVDPRPHLNLWYLEAGRAYLHVH